MAVYYADTSALVKRHAIEKGSAWVKTLFTPSANNTVVTARISVVEVISALNGKVRNKEIDISDYRLASTDFTATCINEYQLIELATPIYDRACQLLEKYKLRAYDSVQLAAALLTNATLQASGSPTLTFLVADSDLLKAAQGEGLPTDNPEDHP
jgi:predicted nucleic acid-binding protein